MVRVDVGVGGAGVLVGAAVGSGTVGTEVGVLVETETWAAAVAVGSGGESPLHAENIRATITKSSSLRILFSQIVVPVAILTSLFESSEVIWGASQNLGKHMGVSPRISPAEGAPVS